jgi:hypothetical protein
VVRGLPAGRGEPVLGHEGFNVPSMRSIEAG